MTAPLSTYEIAKFAMYADLLTEVTVLRADADLLAHDATGALGHLYRESSDGRRHRYIDRTIATSEIQTLLESKVWS